MKREQHRVVGRRPWDPHERLGPDPSFVGERMSGCCVLPRSSGIAFSYAWPAPGSGVAGNMHATNMDRMICTMERGSEQDREGRRPSWNAARSRARRDARAGRQNWETRKRRQWTVGRGSDGDESRSSCRVAKQCAVLGAVPGVWPNPTLKLPTANTAPGLTSRFMRASNSSRDVSGSDSQGRSSALLGSGASGLQSHGPGERWMPRVR